jgi:ubiquinol oxidase
MDLSWVCSFGSRSIFQVKILISIKFQIKYIFLVFSAFFLTYLLSPKICHRFVGFLEEEAVITYTRCIEDLDAGKLPAWLHLSAPQIAKTYWKLSNNAMMRDVLLAVRADEATHRQ